MKIEIFKKEDIKEVSEIENSLYSIPWSEFDFEMVLKDFSFNFVLKEQDVIIGYICSILEGTSSVHLLNIAIKKEYQNQGLGTKFLYFFINNFLKPAGVTQLVLEVRESNKRAIYIYKKFGFVIIDKLKNYYQLPQEDALVMMKRLNK